MQEKVVVVATHKFSLGLEGFYSFFSRFSAHNWPVEMHGKGGWMAEVVISPSEGL